MWSSNPTILFLSTCLLLSLRTKAFARWGPPPRSASFRHAMTTQDDVKVPNREESPASAVPVENDHDNEDGENVKTKDLLSLDSIRSTLIRQEETIIFSIIERAQFRRNCIVYRKDGFGNLGTPAGSTPADGELSFLEYMLVGTETLHCGVRRYTSPEEHAFFPERLPPQGPMEALPDLQYPEDLTSSVGGANQVNFNKKLLQIYIDTIVPSVCKSGDDEQHGSTVLCDIAVLQAISRRVHYGMFVAESKYRSDPEGYQKLVAANDAEGVMALLTNSAVEAKVLRRSRLKAATYGTEPLLIDIPRIDNTDVTNIVAAAAASAVVAAIEALDQGNAKQGKVDPGAIEKIYQDIIIPMTKDIEVAYLFQRCGREPPEEFRP